MATTKAPAIGPKKNAMVPATFGRHGAFDIFSEESSGPEFIANRENSSSALF